VIINENLDQAETELITILNAERKKRVRQVGLASFVSDLTKD